MSILITGDTHGTFDIRKVTKFFENTENSYTKEDFLIICGDVGVCSVAGKAYEADTRKVLRELPVTVLFIDGNHENFDDLNFNAAELINRAIIPGFMIDLNQNIGDNDKDINWL